MQNVDVLEHKQNKLLFDMEALIAVPKAEGRPLTDEEKRQYASWDKDLAGVNADIEKAHKRHADEQLMTDIEQLAGGRGAVLSRGDPRSGRIHISRVDTTKSFGWQFVESAAYAAIAKLRKDGGPWTSVSVDIERFALTEAPTSGGALVAPDQQRPVPGPTLSVVVADLIRPGTTTSNQVPVPIQKTFTNNAAPVAEGAAKPESILEYESVNEPVRKIAHWIGVTEELLDDQPATASMIDAQLRYGVLRKEDQQLLAGTGVGAELLGILARPGLAADVTRVDPATNADAILEQIVVIEASTGLPVSGIVMNPLAWGAIVGAKGGDGHYIAGGPFTIVPTLTLWGKPVATTDQMAATTALVGAFRDGAQIFRNGGLKTAATNAHENYFTLNKVAVRTEERLALAVYRPGAFGRVIGLTTL